MRYKSYLCITKHVKNGKQWHDLAWSCGRIGCGVNGSHHGSHADFSRSVSRCQPPTGRNGKDNRVSWERGDITQRIRLSVAGKISRAVEGDRKITPMGRNGWIAKARVAWLRWMGQRNSGARTTEPWLRWHLRSCVDGCVHLISIHEDCHGLRLLVFC